MEYSVEWSYTAELQLDDIIDYIFRFAPASAIKILTGVLKKAEGLKKHPFSGQKEEYLKDIRYDYRYLVSGNYKIIYMVQENRIIISSVFDTRLNPSKMKTSIHNPE